MSENVSLHLPETTVSFQDVSENTCISIREPRIILLKLRTEEVLPDLLYSEPGMVEAGREKRKERVLEQNLRNICEQATSTPR